MLRERQDYLSGTGGATKPGDVEAFADFFKLVMRNGETRGRKGGLTLK
jgi:hypothetical protein